MAIAYFTGTYLQSLQLLQLTEAKYFLLMVSYTNDRISIGVTYLKMKVDLETK